MTIPVLGSTPVNAQERFVSRFDPDGDGFIYRATPHSPGVAVTAQERAKMIAVNDDQRSIATIVCVAALPLVVIVGVALSFDPATKSWASTAAWSTILVIIAVSAVCMPKTPGHILRGRPEVDKGLPRAEAERRSIHERSWPVLIVTAAGGVAAGFNLAAWTDAYMVLRLLGALLALISIGMSAREIEIKLRMNIQDRQARGGKP